MMVKRYPKVSDAELRRAWSDSTITAKAAADRLGISLGALRDRAHHRGLPPRRNGRPFCVPVPEFTRLWNAGVGNAELAAHFGVRWPSSLGAMAKRLGLRQFVKGEARITMAQYREAQLSRAMRESAEQSRHTAAVRSGRIGGGA